MRRRIPAAVLTIVAVLISTTGCAGMLGVFAFQPRSAGDEPYASEGAHGQASAQVGVPVGDAEVDAEINDAVEVINAFWSDHYSDFYTGGDYQPPTIGGAYTADNLPFCGSEETVSDNAFYCPVDNTIWWDADLMKELYAAGDTIVYLVVAHEWGHAIQALTNDVWVAEELQADCFAAAALYGATDDEYFVWEAGDTAEITIGLTALADETAWTDTTDHGDPLERIDAFNEGRVYGVEGCWTVDG